jgi:hypothetical protein
MSSDSLESVNQRLMVLGALLGMAVLGAATAAALLSGDGE